MSTIPINFVTSDFSRWGVGLERVLDASEVDRNFFAIRTAVEDLIDNPPTPVQIASFASAGLGMTITMSDGSTVGPLPLPILTWRWRGVWLPHVPYAALDVFSVDDVGIYLALQAHTSASNFVPSATSGGQPLYQALFGITSGQSVNGGLAIGSSQDWGQIDALVTATADWGLIASPTTMVIDLGRVGK